MELCNPRTHDSRFAVCSRDIQASSNVEGRTYYPHTAHLIPHSVRRVRALHREGRGALAPLSHRSRTALAPLSYRSRTALAPLSHRSRTALAPLSHRSRTALAPLSHRSRTALAPYSLVRVSN